MSRLWRATLNKRPGYLPSVTFLIIIESSPLPELYFAFFRSHNAVDLQIQASSAAAAAQLSSTTAALYGIGVSDLPKLTAQTRTFMANVAAWSAQEQAYVTQQRAAKKLP